jgi:uncharacterized protein involved in exopolysaccharide biosynthesis
MEQEEPQKTTEERFKEFIEKTRPYIIRLWKARYKLIIFNGIVGVLTVLYLLFLTKPYYRSTITILPEYGSKNTTLGQLSGLAAMAGVKVGEGAPTEIYQNLITSESILEPVIYAKYKTKKFKDSVNLIQYFKIEADKSLPGDLQKRKMFITANKGLDGLISTSVDRMTKILDVSVTMPESKLSADVVNNIASSLDNYVRTKRKSYASEQRFYLEKRVMQVKDSLTNAENILKDFREQNRMITQSPMLLLEQGRLMRQVDILQTVFVEITKQLELAKIDEIRDTPVVNIEEYAQDPIKKAGPKRLTSLIIILFFSFVLSSIYLVYKDNIKRYYLMVKGRKIET